ncbi:MAG: DUF3526 domain-containing protein, partial [Bacteroidota bacterium]
SEIVMRHRTPHFGHVFSGEGYATGYYGYLWADVLTSDAAEAFAEGKAEVDGLSWADRTVRVTERLLAEEGVSTLDSISVNMPAVRLYEGEQEETELYRALFERLADGFEGQGRVAQLGGVLAPLLAVAPLSTALTGTDYRHHRHFAEAAEAYRYDYVQTLNQNLIDYAAPGGAWDRSYVVGDEVWAAIPPFAYEPPTAGWALGGHGLALAFLGLWLVGLAIAVPVAVARMPLDPR